MHIAIFMEFGKKKCKKYSQRWGVLMKNRIKVKIDIVVFGYIIVGCGDKDSK